MEKQDGQSANGLQRNRGTLHNKINSIAKKYWEQYHITPLNMARITTKIGDIFSAQIDGKTKKYFQYIANDLTQLNSDVIRDFKTFYPINTNPDISNIVKDEIDFYAHCVTNGELN